MLLIVNNKMPRPIAYSVSLPGLEGRPKVTQARLLAPGTNEVDADEFDSCTKNSTVWAHWKEKGLIEIMAEVKADSGLAELAPEQAKKVVTETFNLEQLERWHDHEDRPEVKKSIRKRKEFLEAQIKKAKEDAAA